ncbi:membrane hypothetical protein [Nitrolancea hollandica Lb]|uniref:Uncharacterized protein n=1 Tax=Nitrolancea hollandica Lb TaxID=1129897 RepID=I4EKG6_9BACT|nr:membrane hypothetical protein [Nitrolancea hollandica Lb]
MPVRSLEYSGVWRSAGVRRYIAKRMGMLYIHRVDTIYIRLLVIVIMSICLTIYSIICHKQHIQTILDYVSPFIGAVVFFESYERSHRDIDGLAAFLFLLLGIATLAYRLYQMRFPSKRGRSKKTVWR